MWLCEVQTEADSQLNHFLIGDVILLAVYFNQL